ncbi:MAG: hypothetical protein IPK66_10995 [Rhodospirillales bacterium]|nr:hypothetical protein [Rhodospirillales bacterium]
MTDAFEAVGALFPITGEGEALVRPVAKQRHSLPERRFAAANRADIRHLMALAGEREARRLLTASA